jgi:Bcr/CflA subfamily drug resistance transporter
VVSNTNLSQSRSVLVLLTLMSMMGALSVDCYLPAIPQLTQHFHGAFDEIQYSLTTFLLGLGMVQLWIGPISDRYGRKPVFFWGGCIYVVASLLCTVIDSSLHLNILRFMQGIGACVLVTTSYAMVRDIYQGKELGKVLGYMAAGLALSPGLGPYVGEWLMEQVGWFSIFWLFASIVIVQMIWVMTFIPETCPAAFEHKKTSMAHVLRGYLLLFKNPLCLSTGLSSAFGFSAFVGFMTVSPYVFIHLLHLSNQDFAFYFSLHAFAFFFSGMITGRLLRYGVGENILINVSFICIILGSLAMAYFIWEGMISSWFIVVPNLFCAFGVTMLLSASMASVLQPFGNDAGQVSSIVQFLRIMISTILSALLSYVMVASYNLMLLPGYIFICAVVGGLIHCCIQYSPVESSVMHTKAEASV